MVGVSDIEILVRDMAVADAIRWVETRLGPLVEPSVIEGIHYLRTDDERIRVVVTPSMEDGPFLSVFLRGELPWSSSADLAISCADELGKTVRWCDAATNGWMEKQGSRPHQAIDWLDDEQDDD